MAKAGNELVKATAYGAEIRYRAVNFRTALGHMGYEVKYKNPKVFKHEDSDREDRKADWDVGIAIDIIKAVLSDQVDIVVLGSADGDLAPCIEFIVERGIECYVLASGISNELKKVASCCREITEDMLTT